MKAHCLLLASLGLVASCSVGPRPEPPRPKSALTVSVDECAGLSGIQNMFDDSEVSNYQPHDMGVLKLKFDRSITSLRINPVRRRGYSQKFKILAVSGSAQEADSDNPVVSFSPAVDSLWLVFINDAKYARREFFRDSVPFVIASEKEGPIMGISSMEFYSGASLLNDTTIVKALSEPAKTALPQRVASVMRNKIDGSIVDRRMAYQDSRVSTSYKVTRDGGIAICDSEGRYLRGTISEDRDGRLMISPEINVGYPECSGQLPVFINERILEVSQLGIRAHFEADKLDFFNLKNFPELFLFEIRYATADNFTKTRLYDEPICYLRYAVGLDLMEAAREFLSMGYKIKMYDGYRPYRIQGVMWSVCPNPNFLSNPLKGSNHNRGVAVDLSICTAADGKDVDMGTDFDYCGREAYTNYTNLPQQVLDSRNILWSVLNRHGFSKSKTEWWHLSHRNYISASPLCDYWPKEFVEF